MLDRARIAKITKIKDRVSRLFDAGDWETLALYLGDDGGIISEHPRLLRSLYFGDPDYESCVGSVLSQLIGHEPEAFMLIEEMLEAKEGGEDNQSPDDARRSDLCELGVPIVAVDTSTATVMMPFAPVFSDVRTTLKEACSAVGLDLKAADDIWRNSILIQDIFDLIAESCIVIVDFTDKNPNVMYETGVAHALKKEVIPIAQSLDDVPFDLKHHRILIYENNEQGRMLLREKLENRMKTIIERHGW